VPIFTPTRGTLVTDGKDEIMTVALGVGPDADVPVGCAVGVGVAL
jgi:hypothetical protein